jgi:hypothetical protein
MDKSGLAAFGAISATDQRVTVDPGRRRISCDCLAANRWRNRDSSSAAGEKPVTPPKLWISFAFP